MENLTRSPRYRTPRTRPDLSHTWKYNEYRVEGDHAYLLLRASDGTLEGEALIDVADLERVLRAAYWTIFRTKTIGLQYATGVARGLEAPRGSRKPRLFLHRLIAGAVQGDEVDHDNGNGLDCRGVNLRCTDRKGNMNNRRQQRRERQLSDAMVRLLACEHGDPDCECRRYARSLVAA